LVGRDDVRPPERRIEPKISVSGGFSQPPPWSVSLVCAPEKPLVSPHSLSLMQLIRVLAIARSVPAPYHLLHLVRRAIFQHRTAKKSFYFYIGDTPPPFSNFLFSALLASKKRPLCFSSWQTSLYFRSFTKLRNCRYPCQLFSTFYIPGGSAQALHHHFINSAGTLLFFFTLLSATNWFFFHYLFFNSGAHKTSLSNSSATAQGGG